MRSQAGARSPSCAAIRTTSPCRTSISVGRPRTRSSYIEDVPSASTRMTALATLRNTGVGSRITIGRAPAGIGSGTRGTTPAAVKTRIASAWESPRHLRRSWSRSSVRNGRPDRAWTALLRLSRTLPCRTAWMSSVGRAAIRASAMTANRGAARGCSAIRISPALVRR